MWKDEEMQRYLVDMQTFANWITIMIEEVEILERVLFPVVNEGFKCLEEGIAIQPSDIDVIYIYGYGWPVYRGGEC